MAEVEISDVRVECVQGDITEQPDMDAIVNAANAELAPGGGVAGAIHRAAGSGLAKECQAYAPISPGQAVISGGYKLPNKYVIHCLGPVYGRDEPSDELLASCYRKALELAEKNGVESLAFPAISTGVFQFPFEAATEIAVNEVKAQAPSLKSVKRIRFVLFSQSDLEGYERALAALN
ncbi:MAG: macro domain-containing protein [Oceanospirillaceae bacterium]|uniref:macro domain-containing protein n=1 Tax=Marinobacterium litorale TaxID=404770 RepID=UPI0004045BD6|nr:macro domain-containing protein [Marinobacterium litorale]MBS99684.1 macro domain-containing protein [Oceanospirillaceae bacterium]